MRGVVAQVQSSEKHILRCAYALAYLTQKVGETRGIVRGKEGSGQVLLLARCPRITGLSHFQVMCGARSMRAVKEHLAAAWKVIEPIDFGREGEGKSWARDQFSSGG